jgi:hypothetical protein
MKKVPGGVPAGVSVLPGAGIGDVRAIEDGVTIGLGPVSLPQDDVSAPTNRSPAAQAMKPRSKTPLPESA